MFLYFIIHLNKGTLSILISPPWEKFGNFSKFHFGTHSLLFAVQLLRWFELLRNTSMHVEMHHYDIQTFNF